MQRIHFLTSMLMLGVFGFDLNAVGQDQAGFHAFSSTIYPQLRAQCTPCHGDNGIAVGHSVSDPMQAYVQAKNFVDFSSIASSTFVKKVRAKHWLRYDPNKVGLEEDEITSLLHSWWNEGEFMSGQAFAYTSAAIQLPQDLPAMSSGQYQEISWNLGAGDERLEGCVISTKIQRARYRSGQVPGSYRLKDLDTSCEDSSFSAHGIFFLVSQRIAPYENYLESTFVEGRKNESVMVTTEPVILIQRDEVDILQIVFADLTVGTSL